MKLGAFGLGLMLLLQPFAFAQNSEAKPEKLITIMRNLNTLEATYKGRSGRYGTFDELISYAKTAKEGDVAVVFAKQSSDPSLLPYRVRIVTSSDGSHYLASVSAPSNMYDESTWCKTEAFSSDEGLISLGQNIECSGAAALGASSKIVK